MPPSLLTDAAKRHCSLAWLTTLQHLLATARESGTSYTASPPPHHNFTFSFQRLQLSNLIGLETDYPSGTRPFPYPYCLSRSLSGKSGSHHSVPVSLTLFLTPVQSHARNFTGFGHPHIPSKCLTRTEALRAKSLKPRSASTSILR